MRSKSSLPKFLSQFEPPPIFLVDLPFFISPGILGTDQISRGNKKRHVKKRDETCAVPGDYIEKILVNVSLGRRRPALDIHVISTTDEFSGAMFNAHNYVLYGVYQRNSAYELP